MTTAEIQAFLAIAKYKNITRAAETLFISQSSLSTRLKTLERELNCTLFLRRKGQKEINLTESGEKFLPLAHEYANLLSRMMELSEIKQQCLLRVASINSLGTYLLSSIYDGFLEKHPNVNLQIQDTETPGAYKSLKNNHTDIAFTGDTQDDKSVSVIPMFSEPMVFICSEESSYPDEVNISDLSTNQEVYINWTDTFERWHASVFTSSSLPQIRVSIMPQIHYFITHKNMWAFVPLSAAKWLTQMGGVRQCSTNIAIPPRTINCLCLAEKTADPHINLFLQYMRAYLNEKSSHMVTVL